MLQIIIANYGNESLALIQWCIEQQIENLLVLSVDTGWAAQEWQQHCLSVWHYLDSQGVAYQHLASRLTFTELVQQQREFPNKKFQRCTSLLKGTTILTALDDIDPGCTATILLAKRKQHSRANSKLQEYVEESDYYQRGLRYPLLDVNLAERDALIERAGFTVLPHRSLECDPCIHNCRADFLRLAAADLEKTAALESQVSSPMFNQFPAEGANSIEKIVEYHRNFLGDDDGESSEQFDMGCGAIWACGE